MKEDLKKEEKAANRPDAAGKTAEEMELEARVEEERITLVGDKDEEYDFIIVDRFEMEGKEYLALVSCDEKTDMGSGNDPGEANDITIVRAGEIDGERSFFAVTDAEELLGAARIVEERFGHLSEQEQ